MSSDRQLEAFHRLLADAAHGGQARVDALVALSQRTVWVVPWPDPSRGWRTVVSSDGLEALPIFVTPDELDRAATKFGWRDPSGHVARTEVGARGALRTAHESGLAHVVVDLVAEHSMEISREEIEALLSTSARGGSGPFAGAGRVSSTLMRAVQSSSPSQIPPPPAGSPAALSLAVRPTPMPGSLRPAVPVPGRVTPPPQVAAPRPGSSPGTLRRPRPGHAEVKDSMRLMPLVAPPDETMLAALEAALRDFPEVELACLGLADGELAVGVRVDLRMRGRVDALAEALFAASGAPVVMLDDPGHLRAARTDAFMFFPWRRR